jgi:hypothetical protein
MSWGSPPVELHPGPAALDAYAARQVSVAAATAIDLHLQTCMVCRYDVNERVTSAESARIEHNLLAIAVELDAPRVGAIERAITRIGIPADTARLLGATPSLRRSWFIAIGLALFFGLAAANPDRPGTSLVWFLALAPLLPVVGVALAYGPGVDPSYEITLAAPVSGFRLVLVRAAAVLATSIGLTGFVALLMIEKHSAMVGAWLVPALTLSALCLAAMTRLAPRVAAASVSAAWLLVVIAVSTRASDELALFRWGPQVAMAATACAAEAVLVARRRSFDVSQGELA